MNRLLVRPALRVQQSCSRQCVTRSRQIGSALAGRKFSTTTERKNGGRSTPLAQTEVNLKAMTGGRLGLSPISDNLLDPTLFFEAWRSLETMKILEQHGVSYYDYLSMALSSNQGLEVLRQLDPRKQQEFNDVWEAFSDPPEGAAELEYLDDVLSFFFDKGVRILPPTQDIYTPSECIMFMTADEKQKLKKLSQTPGNHNSPFGNFPDLMTPSPLLDPHDVLDLPPTADNPFHNRVVVRNHRSIFHEYPSTWQESLTSQADLEGNDAEAGGDEMLKSLAVPQNYYRNLYQSILMRRTVVQQTGKGKIRRMTFMVLVGDGNGLVGYGEGKHANGMVALNAARLAAVRNMDYVNRFENRTIWTEMRTKLGSTELILRPRPVGFGLRCNPFLHQILRIAGFKDISAKVWGSRNKLNVIKAAFRVLHAGHAPTGMGDGVGGKGKKLSKGSGMKSKDELERARGRKLISLRK